MSVSPNEGIETEAGQTDFNEFIDSMTTAVDKESEEEQLDMFDDDVDDYSTQAQGEDEVQQEQEQLPENVEEVETVDSPADEVNEDAPAETDDVTELRKMIAQMAIELETARNQAAQPKAEEQPVVETQPVQNIPPVTNGVEQVELVTDEEYDNLMEDKSVLNGLLNKVRVVTMRDILTSLPSLTTNLVARHTAVSERIRLFYDENPDLLEYKEFVGHVANSVQSRLSNADADTLFAEIERESRAKLKLPKQQDLALKGKTSAKPSFAGRSRGAGSSVVRPKEDDDFARVMRLR